MLALSATGGQYVPSLWTAVPFASLLLAVAFLPLISACHSFWRRNRNKLLVSLILSAPVLAYYCFLHPSMFVQTNGEVVERAAGPAVLGHVLWESMAGQYIPFIVLLLGLYTIAGGIRIQGNLLAKPIVNTAFLAIGALLASLIGTTGAAMLLIRPLLQTNAERRNVRHTVVFFIFLVCNIGGCLLPIGDPPIFLGYLRGVPFAWTLSLAKHWALCTGILLVVYYLWDSRVYRRENPLDLARDRGRIEPMKLLGKVNFLYLLGVVLAVALLIPHRPSGDSGGWAAPQGVREGVILVMAGMSLLTTAKAVRQANRFTFSGIGEVAALFVGIFITMQAPIEILLVRGPSLGISQPWQFFWATGLFSSVLDNAPTYAVFLDVASSLGSSDGSTALALLGGQIVREDLLAAVSLGAVFMGANTYIGNGPNFMVKAIAEEHGVKMPSFLHYMIYSACVLLPLFLLLTAWSCIIGWL